jgi:hypothetical protein
MTHQIVHPNSLSVPKTRHQMVHPNRLGGV